MMRQRQTQKEDLRGRKKASAIFSYTQAQGRKAVPPPRRKKIRRMKRLL